jgi:hypothetical protein
VACCRTFGIPSRINVITGVPEYFENGNWHRAFVTDEDPPVTGTLHFIETKNPMDPLYHIHFSLARLEDGRYRTLEYPENMGLSAFPQELPLDTGHYLLITGNRRDDGNVLNTMTYFSIRKNKKTEVPVFIRLIPDMRNPVGKVDLEKLMLSIPGLPEPQRLEDLSAGKKMIILMIDPDQEPSIHVLSEMAAYADHFKTWDGKFVIAMPRNKSTIISVLKPYRLPGENVQGLDVDSNICKAFEKMSGEKLAGKLPIVALCDQDGLVFMFSVGYKIGIGEQLLKFTRL